jgi:hypothetical protein
MPDMLHILLNQLLYFQLFNEDEELALKVIKQQKNGVVFSKTTPKIPHNKI